MEKIFRVIEAASCSVLQSYYIAYKQEASCNFDYYSDPSKIEHGFSDDEQVEQLKTVFEKPDERNVIYFRVDVFNIDEIDKYPLLKNGPLFI